MSWFTLPWRSPHPVRKTVALVLLLLGIAGALQPPRAWTWKVEPWILMLALFLAVPELSWPWRSPRPVYSTVRVSLLMALVLAGAIWGYGGAVLIALLWIFFSVDLAVEALTPGRLWHRVISLILLVVAVVIGLQALHMLRS